MADQVLVACFSYSGRTRKAARQVADTIRADYYEISTVQEYPADYYACVEAARAEKKSAARPALAGELPDLSIYRKIVVAYPNWCSTVPMAVLTFLESYDLTGKEIYPLCTHGGGGIAGEADIRNAAKSAVVSRAADGNNVRTDRVAAWLGL